MGISKKKNMTNKLIVMTNQYLQGSQVLHAAPISHAQKPTAYFNRMTNMLQVPYSSVMEKKDITTHQPITNSISVSR